MKTTATLFGLLLLAAATALAGVPRTINYQGRAVNGQGALTGTHQITFRIYDVATGGTPLFTEQQPGIDFKNGIFTAAIGNLTFGGIPESISFDKQLWLGVTISGFNGDAELSPRFTLRASPYALHSTIADSAARAAQALKALRADSAKTLDLPASLRGAEGVNPLFEVRNDKGTALRTQGTTFATVSDGIDSTTKHYVSGETSGDAGKPGPGALYRDNAPMAWGIVSSDGTLRSGFGIDSVRRAGLLYAVYLSNSAAAIIPADPSSPPALAPMITQGDVTSGTGTPAFMSWLYATNPKKQGYLMNVVVVKAGNIDGAATSAAFSIVVFGRPQ
ncbi:MAG: hypothetical protein JWQ98_2844 [Chlorobi bacterium]|nr:hypothetical protein [Chlorobiota bacterium]